MLAQIGADAIGSSAADMAHEAAIGAIICAKIAIVTMGRNFPSSRRIARSLHMARIHAGLQPHETAASVSFYSAAACKSSAPKD
jgi:hypothetical protein